MPVFYIKNKIERVAWLSGMRRLAKVTGSNSRSANLLLKTRSINQQEMGNFSSNQGKIKVTKPRLSYATSNIRWVSKIHCPYSQ